MSERIDRTRRRRRDQAEAEPKLWGRLGDRRLNGWTCKRQAPIERYIADFFVSDARRIIEPGGGQHSRDANTQADTRRTALGKTCGLLVLRLWNNDVMQNMDGVLEASCDSAAGCERPSRPPSPLRGEGAPALRIWQ